ncbi:hypothetical protein HU200_027886 [Digitaria exilis]|uniref:Uncharacterized protein n=1 Tax=Digitaria exilis TaxID=1010633 RepID=A0A835EQB1_9POAL|nr:hypothetical protein HU200_027886 [Digitaria exilis]
MAINSLLRLQTATGNIASALGFGALAWSTVVHLSGFVGELRDLEFWIVTALSFVMACKLVHFYDNEFGKGIYVEEVNAFHNLGQQKRIKWKDRFTQVILVIVIIPKWILWCCVVSVFMYSPFVSMGVSVWRLVQRDYSGDAGGSRANRAKLNAALDIFYALALYHSFFVIYWMNLERSLPDVKLVLKQCEFGKWGPNVLGMYYSETQRRLRKDGELPDKWNLITYGVGLLQSASEDDHLWGARLLDKLFDKDDVSVREELLPSRQSIQNLIGMIGTDKIEDSERAARIVAHLASDLHMTQFPGTLQCICYLLERSSCEQYFEPQVTPSLSIKKKRVTPTLHSEHQDRALVGSIKDRTDRDHKKRNSSSFELRLRIALASIIKKNKLSMKLLEEFEVPMNNPHERRKFFDPHRHRYEHRGAKELISQGLLILERLTQDEENCTEITKHQRLLSKITSPLRSREFLSNEAMVEMVSKSLTVVSRLLTSPGDGATRLRQQLASNREAVSNLMAILNTYRGGGKQLHQDSLEILTELALDDSFKNLDFNELFQALLNIFLEKDASNTMRGKAGEALARLLNVRIAATKGANAADILSKQEAIYFHYLEKKQEVINLLTKVFDQILSSKMGTSADAATAAGASNNCAAEIVEESHPPEEADSGQPHTHGDEQKSDERKLMAAMLSLALVIGNENVISRGDFARAIPEDEALVRKLIEILKVSKHSTAECLRVVKLTCQVVIAMIQAKPSCIKHFNDNEHKFKEELIKSLETMSEIDDCMVFAGDDDREGMGIG